VELKEETQERMWAVLRQLVVGLAGGEVAVAVAGVVGTVAGAYYGASKASETASSWVTLFYEWVEDDLPSFLEENSGFFDWNVKQI
jgi:hypothetical protein